MNTEHEYETKVWLDGKLVDVVATYESDFPDALVYGIFLADESDMDVTERIHPDEFDRIYMEICTKVVEDMADAADMACEGER